MLDALFERITPENFASVITSIFAGLGVVGTALAGRVIYKTRAEPPSPKTAEDIVTAYNRSLENNNAMLSAMVPAVGSMAKDMHELKRIADNSLDVQRDIHLELARTGNKR